eukprot:TRINITY_DN67147_c0_g1_i1.p1 TRINITY_DN67147_c0_g1~~TRINITY_DN67147_c0_g1_i1.p1  ORF type:complete len:310 (-),score=46.27 TRINITY_DN67147_c0_g1_i1:334-1185(-)
MAAALLGFAPGMCAKTMLNQNCQKLKRSPISKQDIIYTSNLVGPRMYQAVVRLNCMGCEEFAGEVMDSPKEAEKAAAFQALEAHAVTFASVAQDATKKRKQNTMEAFGATFSMEDLESLYANQSPDNIGQLMEAAGQALKRQNVGNPALTDKLKLNSLCMKIARRTLVKGDTIYEARPTVGGFQSTVTLACLPGEWGNATWAGEVRSTKAAAEQSAATIALSMICEDAELQSLANRPSGNSGKGKGRGKGKAKSYGTGSIGNAANTQNLTGSGVSAGCTSWNS